MMVDKWMSKEWAWQHALCRERRLMMPDAAHHQGSRSLPEVQKVLVCEFTFSLFLTLNSACLLIILFFLCSRHDVNGSLAMSSRHTLWLTWASGGSAEDYNNPNIHTHVTRYTEIGKALHGDTWDPATAPLSGEAIMRAGGGKKHGRYWLGDSVVDTASTPTLSQLRARTTDSTPPILPRPEIPVASMHAFQVISASFVSCLRTFVSHFDFGVKSCRPGLTKRRDCGRSWKRGWSRSGS